LAGKNNKYRKIFSAKEQVGLAYDFVYLSISSFSFYKRNKSSELPGIYNIFILYLNIFFDNQ
jgi:hypothetical protein